MTFRGFEYQTVLDMQRTVLVAKADLRVIDLEIKVRSMQRDKISLQELEVKRNIQVKFIEQLETLIEEILRDIDLINEDLKDIEGSIFIDKFVFGKTNEEITGKYYISDRTLARHLAKIDHALNCETGKGIKRALTE